MIKVKKSIKDFSVVSAGNIISKLFAAITAIIIARTLGPGNFGIFSIAFSIMTILASGLSGIDYTYVHNHIQKKRTITFRSYVIFKLLVISFLIVAGILFSPLICEHFFNNAIKPFGFNIGLISALSFITFRWVYVYYQARKRYDKFAMVQILYYFVVLLGVILLTIVKIQTYYQYLYPYLITGFLIFLIFIFFIRNNSYHKSDLIFQNLFRIGKWIILSEIFIVLLARLDFLILSHHITGDILGYYSAAIRIVNIYLTFTAAFSAIMLPKASSIRTEKQKSNFYKTSLILFIILLIINIVLVLLSGFIVEILFGQEYINSVRIVKLLLLAYIPFTLYQAFRYLSYTFNKTFLLFIVPFIQCVLLMLIGSFFIDQFGVNGIIMAKALIFVVGLVIFSLSIVREKLPDNNNE